jgi:16S rRNA (guanine527-N7)-methyltransferase
VEALGGGNAVRRSGTGDAAAGDGSAGDGEALERLVTRFGLDAHQSASLDRILQALRAEPDPHTRIVGVREALDGHVADALVALEVEHLRRARRIADLGAGAGFPGLPLAVALPAAHVDLIESAGRKCAVIERLIEAGRLFNARAVHARAEQLAAGAERGAYDAVTARAVAALPVLVEYAAPLLAAGGVFVAWKGAPDEDEDRAARNASGELGLRLEQVRPVSPFPGSHSRRLYVYAKVADTPSRYPRRPGVAVKRPIGN